MWYGFFIWKTENYLTNLAVWLEITSKNKSKKNTLFMLVLLICVAISKNKLKMLTSLIFKKVTRVHELLQTFFAVGLWLAHHWFRPIKNE